MIMIIIYIINYFLKNKSNQDKMSLVIRGEFGYRNQEITNSKSNHSWGYC